MGNNDSVATATTAPGTVPDAVLEDLTDEQLKLAGRIAGERGIGPRNRMTASRTSPAVHVIHPGDVPQLRAHPQGAEILAALGYDEMGRRLGGVGVNREQRRQMLEGQYSASPASEGMTGLDVRNGRIYAEYNTNLQSLADRMAVYEEMRRSDPDIATCTNLITIPIAHTTYWFEPGDKDDEASKLFAEFLNWNLSDGLTRSFNETMREVALGIFYGFSWMYPRYELKTYKGQAYWGWRQFAPRSRSTVYQWKFDDDGGLRGLIQYGKLPSTGEYRFVDYGMEDLLLWTWQGDDNNPEGLGAFRQAYKPYFYKTAYEEFAAIRIERQACGIPVAEGPAGSYDSNDETLVLAILQNIRAGHDAGFIIPEGWKIYMLDLGDSNIPFQEHITTKKQEILQSVGAQFVMLSQGGADGSNALAKDASGTFFDGVNYMADWACEPFNRFAVPRLMERNWGRRVGEAQPKLVHGRVGVRDLEKFARAIGLPFKEGINMPDDLIAQFAKMAGMSESAVQTWLEEQKALQEEERAREEEERQRGREGGGESGGGAAAA